MKHSSPEHTTEQLEVTARINNEIALDLFRRHRAGQDVSDVMHEARLLKAEAQMMRREIRRRRAETKTTINQENTHG